MEQAVCESPGIGTITLLSPIITNRSHVLATPWNLVVETAERTQTILSEGTTVLDLFDQLGSLFIGFLMGGGAWEVRGDRLNSVTDARWLCRLQPAYHWQCDRGCCLAHQLTLIEV